MPEQQALAAAVLTLHRCRDQEDYEVIRKVGRGKYSEVFEGINVVNDQVITVWQCECGTLVARPQAALRRRRACPLAPELPHVVPGPID